jgi:hypothetical protein
MTPLKVLLVGQYFHPPASTVLKCLPDGALVALRAEPDNPWDELAVQVLLAPGQIKPEALASYAEDLAGHGTSTDEVEALDKPPGLLLGHVGASGGKPLARAAIRGLSGNVEALPFVPCAGRLRWIGEAIIVELLSGRDCPPEAA